MRPRRDKRDNGLWEIGTSASTNELRSLFGTLAATLVSVYIAHMKPSLSVHSLAKTAHYAVQTHLSLHPPPS